MGINVEVSLRRNEDPNRMIKRFVKKCKKEGFLKEVIERKRFTKPSEVRRMKKIKRKRVLKKLREDYEKKYIY